MIIIELGIETAQIDMATMIDILAMIEEKVNHHIRVIKRKQQLKLPPPQPLQQLQREEKEDMILAFLKEYMIQIQIDQHQIGQHLTDQHLIGQVQGQLLIVQVLLLLQIIHQKAMTLIIRKMLVIL